MRDVARAADVPVSSVALALHDKPGVSPARRDKVLAVARSLGYTLPREQRTPVIGLLIEDLSAAARLDRFVDSIVQGIYSEARNSRIHVVLSVFHPGRDPVAELRALTRGEIDGMILTNGGEISSAVVREIVSTGVPTVLVENYLDIPVSAVVADNFVAGYAATRHLLDLGHTRIGVLCGSARYISLADRHRGYVCALWEAEIDPDRELMPSQLPGSPLKGYEQTLKLLDLSNPPTAIYAVSDRSARGAYQAIEERGLRVGVDISVVASDNVEESAFRSPPLTTFDVKPRRLGEEAIRVMARVLAGERQVARTIIPGELVVRESVTQAASGLPESPNSH